MQIPLFLLIISSFYICVAASLCDDCREIVGQFHAFFEKSAAGSFGGGNTHWEETRQGSFHASEVRLMEILESLYASNSERNGVLSRVEEYIETWWNRDFRSGVSTVDALEHFVCVNESKFCCPWNRYGESCAECQSCSLYGGTCDGNGSRSGSGDCVCFPGYTGPLCNACNLSTHFPNSDPEIESLQCLPCHRSCARGCSADGPEHCVACNNGWRRVSGNSTEFCEDINECKETPEVCPVGTYCVNKDGSHDCRKCKHPCTSCTGVGQEECRECAPGYVMSSESKCLDIDECEDTNNPCPHENEKCINTPGSFHCDCEDGFLRISGKCVKRKSKPMSLESRSKMPNPKQKKVSKTIWTLPYTLEFLKFFSIMTLFAFLLSYFSDRTTLGLSVFILSLAYICYQSTVFDSIFTKQT